MKPKTKQALRELLEVFFDLPAYLLACIIAIKNLPNINLLLKRKERQGSCTILGNGPSIGNDWDVILSELNNTDFFCVNHFADSDLFEQIRPQHYSFVDPYFWMENTHEDFQKKRLKTFENLVEKICWPITVYVPNYSADYIRRNLASNKFITIYPYLNNQIKGAHSKFTSKLLRTGIFTPFSINVLCQALYISTRLGYKNIRLYGADTSWYKDLYVNQETNEVSMKFLHFYGEEMRPVFLDNTKTTRSSMVFELWKVYETFVCYRILAEYCKNLNIEVINCTSISDIDIFQRIDRSIAEKSQIQYRDE